ncbi:MAG: anthranilate phosphoribosyltransferase [Gammaproteobacteria bacterium]|nr:anthranilate phosphoribosyltransferase [Gammaproteobacteria bacterium]MAW27964.1 anthranilate phosphoribosyltransferase [Gammaproteobacteria bacterium]OUU10589.1 MAG: anthranilate phosphoribosyltransferase [Gammaproteobacteria bacterium TMED34]OUU10896.1 MAG: anthranilate phosphoribosyltransferase [Gammaproteobacteria bacterium TMED34]
MDMPSAIGQVIEGQDLSAEEMLLVMRLIMSGEATDAQIGGFLVALRLKGETVDEISAAAMVMRELATPVDVDTKGLVDTCGTGGSGSNKFNVSTASAFVAAAAGARVAKHGNRGASSKSGSADLLEAAGAEVVLTPEQVARCIENIGVGFLFAVSHHGAMKHAIGPRREMVVRTIFNALGPLTNPAGAKRQVLGVYSPHLVRPVADVLMNLGSEHVLVVHSEDRLDEISISAPTYVAELKDGSVEEYQIRPEDFGLTPSPLSELVINDSNESLAMVRRALSSEHAGASNMVALNAGAAIYASGKTHSLKAGVDMAQDAIGSGLAGEKLKDFAAFTRQVAAD